MSTDLFDHELRGWVRAACAAWGYEEPGGDWYHAVSERLPRGLRHAFGRGIEDGSITIVDGFKFRLAGAGPGKGPYTLLERSPSGRPGVTWEYYIQVAEFMRLHRLANILNMQLLFEDGLMDLALYDGKQLVVCYEVKERASSLDALVAGIRTHGAGIDANQPDRGNDPLRKAKYLLRFRPQYFCALAIGKRLEFSVTYDGDTFALRDDVIPV